MKIRVKRSIMIATIAVFVGVAAYLNWSYSQGGGMIGANRILGQSTLVGAQTELSSSEDGSTEEADAQSASSGDYFNSARLSRQEARDASLSLLKDAAADTDTDQAVIDDANAKIQQMAADTLTESNIENLVKAKGYTDCVAFLNQESISVVVAGTGDELETSDIAKISDIVMEETGLTADKIKIMEAN